MSSVFDNRPPETAIAPPLTVAVLREWWRRPWFSASSDCCFDTRPRRGADLLKKPFSARCPPGIYALRRPGLLACSARRRTRMAGRARRSACCSGVEMVGLVGPGPHAVARRAISTVGTPLNVGLYAVMAWLIVGGVWVSYVRRAAVCQ